VFWPGCSAHHMGYAGTISVSSSTIRGFLADVAASVHAHGFRKLLIVNSHGGNRAVLAGAIQDLGPAYADMTIAGVTYWDVAREGLNEIRKTAFGGMGHACELETSVILSFAGNLVDMSKAHIDGIMAQSAFTQGEMLAAPVVTVYKPVTQTSHHGGYGDPSVASAEHGSRILELVTQGLLCLCEDLLADRL
jgi:creatinine amidohydrolase